jgi:hypothetical protein
VDKPLCVLRGANLPVDDAMSQVHEFMLLGFADGVEEAEQTLIMRALDDHLAGCEGMLAREYFRADDGRWVEHVTWATQAHRETSARLEDDASVAALFDRFDTETVYYACCERIDPDHLAPARGDEVASL